MGDDIEELRKTVQDHTERIQKLEETVNSTVALDKQLSMSEFVNNEVDPDTHTEKIVAIGYYLEAYENQDSFTKDDLQNAYQKCGLTKTKNFSARAARAVSKGWLDIVDEGGPRHWQVTKTGAETVEEMRGEESGE